MKLDAQIMMIRDKKEIKKINEERDLKYTIKL
jgi:hypothetical protein